MLDVRFFVEGDCLTKGNHDAFPIARARCIECKPGRPCGRRNCFGGTIVGAVITDDGGKELEAWEQLVRVRAISARNISGGRLVDVGPVQFDAIFVLPRPASHWTTSGRLTSEGIAAGPLHWRRPDRDKLLRAISDGIIGALVKDDSQLAVGDTAKVYAPWKGKTGVAVRARQVSSLDGWIEHELAYHGIHLPKQEALL